MQTNATIGAEVVLLRTSKEFHAGRTSPTMTGVITNRRSREDIDAAIVQQDSHALLIVNHRLQGAKEGTQTSEVGRGSFSEKVTS